MTKLPPLLPYDTFVRVTRLAKFDGLIVLIVASFCAVGAAMGGDFPAVVVGLLIAGAGAVELHGVALLHQSAARGMNWLVVSQLFLLFTILAYCGLSLFSPPEIPSLPDMTLSVVDLTAQRLGMSREEYFRFLQRLVLLVFAVVSFFYQGGMALYYHRRRDIVRRALMGHSA